MGFLLCFICFTGCSASSKFINFGVDEADCTISQSHFKEVATGMAHLKTSVLGLSLQTHHKTTVVFVPFRTVYPLMKKRWKRNVKADSIEGMYQVHEQHQEVSFGSSPMSSSCPAQCGSYPSDTACTRLCQSHHILTEASNIFRNWELTRISMDLFLSAILTFCWIKREIFFEMCFTVFMCPCEILQSGAALHIFCV